MQEKKSGRSPTTREGGWIQRSEAAFRHSSCTISFEENGQKETSTMGGGGLEEGGEKEELVPAQ